MEEKAIDWTEICPHCEVRLIDHLPWAAEHLNRMAYKVKDAEFDVAGLVDENERLSSDNERLREVNHKLRIEVANLNGRVKELELEGFEC
jgi:cell division protein FtsB